MAITKGPHISNLTATATDFCGTEILEHFIWGFSIFLTKEDSIRLFSILLHIYQLASVEQQNRNPRII